MGVFAVGYRCRCVGGGGRCKVGKAIPRGGVAKVLRGNYSRIMHLYFFYFFFSLLFFLFSTFYLFFRPRNFFLCFVGRGCSPLFEKRILVFPPPLFLGCMNFGKT